MNFLKKLFSKEETKENSSDIVEVFIDTYIESEDVFILTESMLEHDKEAIKDAFDKRIEYQKFMIERSGISGELGKEMKKQFENTKAMKVHIDDFVKIPSSLKDKVEKANMLFEEKLSEFDNKNKAMKNMPEWAQKLYMAAWSNNIGTYEETNN